MSVTSAGPTHEAKRQASEAQRTPQAQGDAALSAPIAAIPGLSSGASEPPPALASRAACPPGRGFRGAQAGYALRLQRTCGNREAARRLGGAAPGPTSGRAPAGPVTVGAVQPKLTVSMPGDPHEQEADRVADAVMRMAAPGGPASIAAAPILLARTPAIQRFCAACEALVQRRSIDAAPALQAEGDQGGPATVVPEVAARIGAMQGGGQPLPAQERTFFEDRMGADLSGVRLHTGSDAAETSQALSARAYTVGADVAFGAGEYQPGTDAGRHLMAHELTHVVQQGGAAQLMRAPVAAPVPVVQRDGAADASAAQGICPVCGRAGTGRCPDCGEAFGPAQRQAADAQPVAGEIARTAATPAAAAAPARVAQAAQPAVQRLGLDDVLSLGRDGAINLVARFSPGLADFIRNGPMGMLVESIKRGVQTWLRGVLGSVNIGGAISGLVSSLTGAFAAIRASDNPACATLAASIDGLRKLGQAIMDSPAIKTAQAVFSAVAGVFQKIGDVLIGGAFDTIMGIVGGVADLAKTVWGWIVKAKDAIGVAWSGVKKVLGLDDDENGIMAKLKAKAAEGWETIKRSFAPLVGPLKTMLKLMLVFSPAGPTILIIKYLPPLVETVQWLWAHKGDTDIVKSSEAAGHTVLPKLLRTVQGISQGVKELAGTLVKGATELHEALLSVLGVITGLPLLSMAQGLMQALSTGVQQLVSLAQTGIEAAAKSIGELYEKAKKALQPFIDVLVPLAMCAVNPAMIPIVLAGKAWLALDDCYKEPIINFLLDIAIGLLKNAPDVSMFGPLWKVLRQGVIGFLEGVRGKTRDEKVRITNKLAKIISGGNPAFMIGFAKGLLIGLWKGLKSPFELVYDLIKLLNHVQAWAEKAGEQALDQALAPAGAAPATATAGAAPVAGPPAPGAAGASANGAGDPGQVLLKQKLEQLVREVGPPTKEVTANFMPAMQETFTSGGGITYADVKAKFASLLASAEDALHKEGTRLANVAVKSFLNDANDAQLGEDVGDISGQILFEIILLVLTEGLIEVLKPLQGIAKMLDFVGEAMGAAFKWLGKIGGWVADGVKGLWKFVENSGAGKRVVKALDDIGKILLRYADELLGLGAKKAGGEAAGVAGSKAAKGVADGAGARAGREGVQHADDIPVGRMSNAELAEAGVPVRIGDVDHTLKPVRVGDQIQIWLCTTCGNMIEKIDNVLAKISDSGPTKSLHTRLTNLRARANQLEAAINAGDVPFNRIPAEANQLAAEMRNLGKKFPGFDRDLNVPNIARPDPSDYAALAERLGYTPTNFRSHGQPVFERGGLFITPDVDAHSGGVWKMADSVRNLGSKRTRMGTYDADLNRIGD